MPAKTIKYVLKVQSIRVKYKSIFISFNPGEICAWISLAKRYIDK
jgi:hypothetical protein